MRLIKKLLNVSVTFCDGERVDVVWDTRIRSYVTHKIQKRKTNSIINQSINKNQCVIT
jgi:hypothetical protein